MIGIYMRNCFHCENALSLQKIDFVPLLKQVETVMFVGFDPLALCETFRPPEQIIFCSVQTEWYAHSQYMRPGGRNQRIIDTMNIITTIDDRIDS